jgi:hypothetical protein
MVVPYNMVFEGGIFVDTPNLEKTKCLEQREGFVRNR